IYKGEGRPLRSTKGTWGPASAGPYDSLKRIAQADLHRPRLVRGNRAQEIGAVARADRVGEVDAVQRVVDLPEESRRALAPDPVHVLQPQVEQHLVGAFDAVADRHAVGVHLRDDGPRQV